MALFSNSKDASGCHTCNCSVIGECDTTYINSFCDWPECVFGYAQDKKGCDMCQCNSNPKGMFVDQEFLNDTDSRPLRKKQVSNQLQCNKLHIKVNYSGGM